MRHLLLLLALPVTLRAQAPASVRRAAAVSDTAPALGEVRGAFWALSVADLAASTRWYSETLGLRVTLRMPPSNGAAVTVLEGGGLTVELLQLEGAAARVEGPERTLGYFKAGVVVEDLTRTLATLRARGAEVAMGPFPARDGQRANAIIRDNAGNLLQLFQR